MKEIGKSYFGYCRNCESVQEMIYRGPLVHKNDLDKVPDLKDFKDIHLHFCKRCQSTLSYSVPEDGENK